MLIVAIKPYFTSFYLLWLTPFQNRKFKRGKVALISWISCMIISLWVLRLRGYTFWRLDIPHKGTHYYDSIAEVPGIARDQM